MIVVTGATGHLGRLVVKALLKTVPAGDIVAAARSPDKADDLAKAGVTVRQADYNRPETLDTAFAGADKVLLISSSEVGRREAQHRAVIDAAKRAGVSLLAYTSLLHADISPLGILAKEHRVTETLLRESGLPTVLLRNGWYNENYAAAISQALAQNAVTGCAGEGLISSAARADYAAAAAVVLTGDGHAGKTYELAGDGAYTLAELAAEISRQSGTMVNYVNLTQAGYQELLKQSGLPEPVAAMLADSGTGTSLGGLFDNGRQLSALIGRPTTPISQQVAEALNAAS
ncbi:SDR family oxidoreductase [Martelella alba]|uniref:SDR family oxidoreductase n=1 Tax=Martelella alba TaxID=2590451 RepID=A0ABY2SJG8_9HYPH|nr:SDR family oxidoreductase [Martelella alba]TKI05110.1 SDR family oxidoreductase [Martelella alba]